MFDNNKRDLKDVVIQVVDKYDRPLSPTNGLIAKTLIKREKAVWVVKDKKIKLMKTKQDWKNLKKKIIEEEHRVCYICKSVIPEDVAATIDHVNPKSKLGKDERANLRCCCKRCNDNKADMDIHEFYIQAISNRERFNYINVEHLERVKAVFEG